MSGAESSSIEKVDDMDRQTSQHVERSSTHENHENRLRVVHTDGTIDYIDNEAVGGDAAGMAKGYFKSFSFISVLLAHCLGNICAYVGYVMPANTLSLINERLGPSPNINWVATSWTLASCVGFLLFGRLSDIFGRRWMVIGVHIVGLIGCIIGATAQSVDALIAASTCNGLGAAGQLSFGTTMGELVPNRMRGPVIALIFASSGPFAVFGPSIARALMFNTEEGWRWNFYMGIIFTAVALALYGFTYFPPNYDQLHIGKTRKQQLMELDYIGMFLFISGSCLFLIGLSWGGTLYPWTSAPTLCTLIIGFFTLVGFAFFEGYGCKVQPLMPPRLFKNIPFVAISLIAAIGAMIYYSLTVIWPTLVQTIYTDDPFEVGIRSSIVGGGILLGQIGAGLSISFVPKVKWQTVIMSGVSFAFFTALVSLDASSWDTTIALASIGLVAVGFVDNIAFPGVTLVVDPGDIGLATGVMGSLRALGGAVAQALYLSVLNNKLSQSLPARVTPAATDAGLPQSSLSDLFAAITAGDFSSVPGMTPSITKAVSGAVTMAYTDAFRIVFYCTIPFSVIMIAASFWVPNMDHLLGNNVAKKLQNFTKGETGDPVEKKVEEV